MFNKYYQDELSYLRELGNEFAAAYPAIAPMLAETGGDPDVERLLEGVAFLTGKLRHKIDDELPEVIHSVAQLLFPHFVRQIPATSIIQFTPLANVVREKVLVPRSSEIGTVALDGLQCRFRTTSDVELAPLTIEDVRIDTGARLTQTLRIELRVAGGANFGTFAMDKIRFYIHGERRLQDDLRLWIGAHLDSVAVASIDGNGNDTTHATLPARAARLVGFSEDEALFPYPKTVYPGYRLLQEFFTLPQRFAFFEISGLDRLPKDKLRDRVALLLEFKDGLPNGTRVAKDTIRLFCTPVVNLFPGTTDPLKPDNTKFEYLVRPSGGQPDAFEIYSVDRVVAVARRTSQRLELPSFYSFDHELHGAAASQAGFYQLHLKPATIGEGVDLYMSFGTPADSNALPEFDAVSVEATCTNRNYPAQLKVGDISVAMTTSPAVATFTNIIGVSAPIAPPVGRELQWRVLSHMAMSFRSIAELETLRATIDIYNFHALYDRQVARAHQLRTQAIKKVEVKPTDRLFRGAPIRGVRAEIEMDENGFAGEGEMYLFASVLNELFASYVSLNSFTQLRVRATNSNAVYTWDPKSGNQTLL
ncbi:MAG: type VI secretion system baseplate subunit TssF [Myxococcales bacterium]|nr:type VI secretion system baseplate subunit TssF [Myxococcales bacterium]